NARRSRARTHPPGAGRVNVTPLVSVVLPTHNPNPGRLRRTLAGLAAQTLPSDKWEAVLIDNASSPPVATDLLRSTLPAAGRVMTEPQPGLSFARQRGFTAARAPCLV